MIPSLACCALSIFLRFGTCILWLLGALSLLGVVLRVDGYSLADLPTILWSFAVGVVLWSLGGSAWRTAQRMW
jgi:hypothetical protein